MNLSLVIPITDIRGEKNIKALNLLLNSIVEGEIYQNANIVCVFDSCREYFIDEFLDKYKFIIPIVNEGNRLNFSRNSNLGLRYAHKILGTSVVLVNQDCILPHWKHFSKVVGEGLVSATSIVIPEGRHIDQMQPPEHKKLEVKHKFPFYCVYIDKAVMDMVGYLDGAFQRATFEDDEYITRTLLAGFPCYLSNVCIHHEGTHINMQESGESASGAYTERDLHFNLVKYGNKYQVPQEIPHDGIISWILDNHVWQEEMAVR